MKSYYRARYWNPFSGWRYSAPTDKRTADAIAKRYGGSVERVAV